MKNTSCGGIQFIDRFLLPMGILTVYYLSFWQIVPRVFSRGVNSVFAHFMVILLLSEVLVLSAGYFAYLILFRKKVAKYEYQYSIAKLPAADLLLVLLPMTPVSGYICANYNMMSNMEAVFLFVFFLLFSAFFIYLVPMVVGHSGTAPILVAIGTAFTFTITVMPLLSQHYSWYEYGNVFVQFLVFAGVFLAVLVMYKKKFKGILFSLLSLLFFSNFLVHFGEILNKDDGTLSEEKSNELIGLVDGKIVEQTPNIYLMIYDSYAPTEVMQQYGIDNRSQEFFLKEMGFIVYPQVYSLGPRSSLSMNRVLDLTANDDENSRRGMSGNGSVQRFLKNLGYETYGIFASSYEFRGTNSSYDYSYPNQIVPVSIQIISGIMIGEFRFDLGFLEFTHDEYVSEKQKYLASISDGQVLFYSHSNLPDHSQTSGKCLSNEMELYIDRLSRANTEMREDLEILLANDPDAIIIVAGDHGPYQTKNCYTTENGGYDISEITRLDILDRFGTFLAIKWPDGNFEKYDDITILQDIFPSVFAYMYQDEILLQARMDEIIEPNPEISGVSIENDIIHGGVNDGEPLFLPNDN